MLTLLGLLVFAQGTTAGDADLTWKLVAGEKLRYRVTRDQRFEVHSESINRGGSLMTREDFTITVDKVDADGKAVVSATLDAFRGKLVDDDMPDLTDEYDSTVKGSRPGVFFEENAANLAKSRTIEVAVDGHAKVIDAEVKAAGHEDPTSWTWMFAGGAPHTAAAKIEQHFPGTFALEHGLLAWATVASSELKVVGNARQTGLDCVRFELAPRFEFDLKDEFLRESTAKHKLEAKPSAGTGSMLFASRDGVLVELVLSGKNTAKLTLADPDGETMKFSMQNSLTVELVEQKAPTKR